MKLKQIKLLILASLVVISSATGLVLSGAGTGNQTVKAYACPGTGSSGEPLYEYHESDGKCWKLDYKNANVSKPQPLLKDGIFQCPDGTSPSSGSKQNECKVACATGDPYHSDSNTCYHYTNGEYVDQETQKIEPTLNSGDKLDETNGTCTDGFQYVKQGGKDGAGCYQIVNGAPRCGKDQNAAVNPHNTDGNSPYNCSDSGKTHLVPKNTSQSSDKTKPKVTGTDCDQLYPGANQQTQRDSCNAGKTNPNIDCSKEADAEACKAGQQKGGAGEVNNEDDSLSECGEAQTVLITCSKTDRGANIIGAVLKFAIAALTGLVGIAAVAGIVWESLQYARAQDDQSIVSGAKNRIRDIIIGLVVYIFMIAFVNWLVPGGIIPG